MNALRHFFAEPWALFLLTVLPNLAVLALMAVRRRRRVLTQLGRIPVLMGLTTGPWPVRLLRALCLFAGLFCLGLGAAGPHWGRDAQAATAPGRDLVVVLDLSRSMFAEDVLPSRLEQAKAALLELADAVQKRGGHRLGLVVFASRSRVICPLTHDYDHFREKLLEIDAEHLPPEVRPGPHGPSSGTRIGAGLRQAVEAHDPRYRGFQDILLISDGDDPERNNEWAIGATEAKAQAIPVWTVGIGDTQRGGRIPVGGGYLNHDDQEVWTKLTEKPLQEIAVRTGGAYLASGTEPPQLGRWFRDQIERRERRASGEDPVPVYRQRYQWFLAPALVLLALAIAIPERLGRMETATMTPFRTVLGMVGVLAVGVTLAADPIALVRKGNQAFDGGQPAEARECYTEAEERATDPGLVAFNKAAAYYRLGDHREAELHYRRSLDEATGLRRPAALYNLGNCLLQRSGGRDAEALKQAAQCYRRCLHDEAATNPLRDDARYNLELALLLLAKAKAEAKKDQSSDPPPEGGNKSNPRETPRDKMGSQGPEPQGNRPTHGFERQPAERKPGANNPVISEGDPPPGKGALPPIPDQDQLVPLPPEDTEAHLRQAAERILRDRREHQKRSLVVPSREVKDW